MSRNELPETAPEGIDDQTWFYLHETLRKFDSAINRIEAGVDGLSSADPTASSPLPMVGYVVPSDVGLLNANSAGTVDSGPLNCGPIGGGYIRVPSTQWVSTQGSFGNKLDPENPTKLHLVASWSSSPYVGTMVGANALVYVLSSIPQNFKAWKLSAIRVFWGMSFAGVSTGSLGAVQLMVVTNSGNVSVTKNVDESGGAIFQNYTSSDPLTLTKSDLAGVNESFRPGDPLYIRLSFGCTSTTGVSGIVIDVGRVELNWE